MSWTSIITLAAALVCFLGYGRWMYGRGFNNGVVQGAQETAQFFHMMRQLAEDLKQKTLAMETKKEETNERT